MEMVFLGLGGLLMLGAFVCNIIVIVKMFQNEMTGLGVASILGLFCMGIGYILTLIFGWKHKNEWNLGTIMPIYTACFVIGIILYGVGYAILIPKVMQDLENLPQSSNTIQVDDQADYYPSVLG